MILLIGIATAEIQTLGTFKLDSTINLIQNCYNSSYSNISRVLYPNSSFAINTNTIMTKNGDEYNYSFTQANTIGQYLVYGYCDENGVRTNWAYDFTITTTGDNLSGSQSSLYITMLVIAICLFLLCGYGLFKLPWSNTRNDDGEIIGINDLKYLKMFLAPMGYVLALWIMWIGWNLSYGYLSYSLMANFFKTFYYIMLYGMIPLLILFVTFLVVKYVEDKKIEKLIGRGLTIR